MDNPIACSLPGTDLAERVQQLADLRRDALLDRAAIPGGTRLVFADAPVIAARLRAAVDAGAACCPFT